MRTFVTDDPYDDDLSRPARCVSAAELLAEPEEQIVWLVDGLLPAGGLSLMVAKPKVGKSTLARTLAIAIVDPGARFLDRRVTNGPVLLLALEEKRADVRRHLEALGLQGEHPLHIHVGAVPVGNGPKPSLTDRVAWLADEVRRVNASLVLIDPLARFAGVRKIEDYAEITAATEPLIALAHTTGVHISCTHHAGKGERDGIDAPLGSQALGGFVDTLLVLRRYPDGLRAVESIQRSGTDLPPTAIVLTEAGAVQSAGELKAHRLAELVEQIRIAVTEAPRTEEELKDNLGGDRAAVSEALRLAVTTGVIKRTGAGKRGDPFKYGSPR
jgi:hypothetical protein